MATPSQINQTSCSAQTAFLLHIIALQVKLSNQPIPRGNYASHICNRRACFNPKHIFSKSAQVNNSQKGCLGPIFCPDHGHKLINLCPHNPQCI
ncbi:uncharacterized protein LY79DRAFT_571046 [Colletotrichum navitas]|uniref:Zinc-binding loop region of homing endonuclease domain-containing protein n=1 Tax=Colletotrichum navitas TaxID=681940 RepID=A0AAD8PLA4_9PEZI|nr:uncharacterized protein LY79DRAFT_571046 [Colletotrichum navitas]KAK1569893.1 hypothetical protein LY79DRAFT_571046 [Colletotrichum navitas]